MNYKKASSDKERELQEATKHLTKNLESNKTELKKLLSPDLAQAYSLCYWSNDGCYYCSDDGRNWYVVKCIT